MKRTLFVAFSLVAAAASAQNLPVFFSASTGSNNANDRTVATKIDASANVYRLAKTFNGTNQNFNVSKYTKSGSLVWSKDFDLSTVAAIPDTANAMALDPTGNPVVTGSYASATAGVTNMFLMKLSATDGSSIFTSGFGPASGTKMVGYDVVVGTDGTIYTAIGRSNSSLAERPLYGIFTSAGANTTLLGYTNLGQMTHIALDATRFYYGGNLNDSNATGLVGSAPFTAPTNPTGYLSEATGAPYEKIQKIFAVNRVLSWTGYATSDAAGTTSPRYHIGVLELDTTGTATNGGTYTSSTVDGIVGTDLAYDATTGTYAFQYVQPGSPLTTGIDFGTYDSSTGFFNFTSSYSHAGNGIGIVSLPDSQFGSFSQSGSSILAFLLNDAVGVESSTTVGSGTVDALANGILTKPQTVVSSADRAASVGGGSSTGARVYALAYAAGPNDDLRIREDTPVTIDVLQNDGGVGTTKTVSISTNPGNGSATLSSNGTLTYTPNVNFNGTDSFTYNLYVDGVLTATPTVSVTVLPVNDAPNAVADFLGDIPYRGYTTVTPLTNDSDPDSDASTLRITAITQPANGVAKLSADRKSILVKANANTTGAFTFTYTVADDHGAKSSTTISGTFVK